MTARVLLLSNSTQHGRGFLDHAESLLRDFLGGARRILFFPFALADRDGYGERVRQRLEPMGFLVNWIRGAGGSPDTVESAEAFFVGGGNTFRLLKELQDRWLIEAIRRRVGQGVPYVGSSAGSNVAGPTISTTKDMPIVQPQSFRALGLVPFQISPHYLDPDPSSKHMGETQEERILQFLEESATPVVALREGAVLRIEGNVLELHGAGGARIFRRGEPAVERTPVCRIEDLLSAPRSA